MRVNLFFHETDNLKVRALGDAESRFVTIDTQDCTIFFQGMGRDCLAQVRELGEKLLDAAATLNSLITEDEAVAKASADYAREQEQRYMIGEPSTLDQHDTLEEHRGER